MSDNPNRKLFRTSALISGAVACAFSIYWRRQGGTFWTGMAIVLAGALVAGAIQLRYLLHKQRRRHTSALLNPDRPESAD